MQKPSTSIAVQLMSVASTQRHLCWHGELCAKCEGEDGLVITFALPSALPQPAIKIFNISSVGLEELNVIKHIDGFMGQKIAPPKCLAFHPYKVCVGGRVCTLTLYGVVFTQ